jgi:REP element-mobilizing transposase RayT
MLDGSVYFITFRLANGTLTREEVAIVLNHIRSGDPRFYALFATVVMPDHVHLLIRPNPGMDLSRVMKGIKGVSARLINQDRGTSGAVWQDESWDRLVRDAEDLAEKMNYMLNNPVKSGLVEASQHYEGWYYNPSD